MFSGMVDSFLLPLWSRGTQRRKKANSDISNPLVGSHNPLFPVYLKNTAGFRQQLSRRHKPSGNSPGDELQSEDAHYHRAVIHTL
jgi:hypothetical protein